MEEKRKHFISLHPFMIPVYLLGSALTSFLSNMPTLLLFRNPTLIIGAQNGKLTQAVSLTFDL